jgi:hypothetical protein
MSEKSRFTIQLDTGGTFTDGYVSSPGGAVPVVPSHEVTRAPDPVIRPATCARRSIA